MPKVSTEIKFKRKAFGEFLCHKKKTWFYVKRMGKLFSILYFIFLINEKKEFRKVLKKY